MTEPSRETNVVPFRGKQTEPAPQREIQPLPTRQRVQARAWWETRRAARNVLHAPALVKAAAAPEVRGLVRSIAAWRHWVANDELHEEIKKEETKRAQLLLKLHDSQGRRWRVTLAVTFLFAATCTALWWFVGQVSLFGVAAVILLVLWFVGRKPDVDDGGALPVTRLAEGMPLASLRASIESIIEERCRSTADVAVQNTAHGWAFQLNFTSSRPDDDKVIKELEQGLGAPTNSITMVQDPDNASRELGRIQMVDPLERCPYLSEIGAGRLSVTQPLPVGMRPDGSELTVNLLRTNWLFVGRSDSGKSTALNTMGVRLSECHDVYLQSIDVTGAVTFAVHRNCIGRRAETVEEAKKLLRDELEEIDRRTRSLNDNLEAGDVVASIEPSSQTPQRVLLIDELPVLADDTEFVKLLLKFLMRGRKAACTAVIGSQGAGQNIAGSAAFREAVHGIALFGCGVRDIGHALGDDARSKGWRADTLTKPGTCYIRDRKQRLPEVVRFSDVTPADVARRSLQLQYHMAGGNQPQVAVIIPEVLAKVEAVFLAEGVTRLSTVVLLDLLGEGWTAEGLAEELRPYGVSSKVLRFGDIQKRGYEMAAVQAAIKAQG